jgi:hypothetical protein
MLLLSTFHADLVPGRDPDTLGTLAGAWSSAFSDRSLCRARAEQSGFGAAFPAPC